MSSSLGYALNEHLAIVMTVHSTQAEPILSFMCRHVQPIYTAYFRLQAFFIRATTLKYKDGGVVCQCVKGEGHKIRMPAHTVPGPRLAQRSEHNGVAMDPTVVLRQAGVSASMGFILGLPCLLP